MEEELRIEGVWEMGNGVEEVGGLVEFEMLGGGVEEVVVKKEWKSGGGGGEIDVVVMLKVIFVEGYYGLGEEEIE